MTTEEFDPDAAVRISAAIVKAIAEAKVLVDAENLGPELHDVVRHAREMHNLLREQVAAPSRMSLIACADSATQWAATWVDSKSC